MGQPGTGKTTLAYKLAASLEIDQVLSTDILRTALKSVYREETNKLLFTVTHESWQLYGEKTYDNIYQAYYDHCINLYPYINYVLSKSCAEDRNIIIEGVHVMPFNYDKLDIAGFDVHPIYLSVSEKDNLIDRYKQKNAHRLKKYDGWSDNYDIIRYIEHRNLLKMVSLKKDVVVLDCDTIDNIFKRCMEVLK
jgi:2-phosphoglycerate kinase